MTQFRAGNWHSGTGQPFRFTNLANGSVVTVVALLKRLKTEGGGQ